MKQGLWRSGYSEIEQGYQSRGPDFIPHFFGLLDETLSLQHSEKPNFYGVLAVVIARCVNQGPISMISYDMLGP